MIAETVLGEMYIKDRSYLGMQLLVHHFVAIALIYMALSIGTGAILIGQLVIMLEYSTISLNYRTLLYKEEWNKTYGIIN